MSVFLEDIEEVIYNIKINFGEEVFGNLSWFGMSFYLQKYAKGRYNKEVHNFYNKNYILFNKINCYELLEKSRQRFNKEIKSKISRI